MADPKVRYRLHKARDGSYYFTTESAGNHEPLTTSEMYTDVDSARNGAEAAGYEGERLEVEDDS